MASSSTNKDSARQGEAVMVKDASYVKLYKAVRDGDWSSGKGYLDRNPELLTVIHMAAASSRNASFLRELVDYRQEKGVSLTAKDGNGQTALHCAFL